MKKKEISILDPIRVDLPELIKAVKLCQQAAKIGFDWPSINPVFNKLEEEITELKGAMKNNNKAEILDELGDVLFVCTNLARHLGINPQHALQHANLKFEKRFKAVEKIAHKKYPKQSNFDLEMLDKIWNEVKILEKSNM